MLVKFTDEDNKPILVDLDSITVVAQACNDENVRLITIAIGGLRGTVQVPVKESIEDIQSRVNEALHTQWD